MVAGFPIFWKCSSRSSSYGVAFFGDFLFTEYTDVCFLSLSELPEVILNASIDLFQSAILDEIWQSYVVCEDRLHVFNLVF